MYDESSGRALSGKYTHAEIEHQRRSRPAAPRRPGILRWRGSGAQARTDRAAVLLGPERSGRVQLTAIVVVEALACSHIRKESSMQVPRRVVVSLLALLVLAGAVTSVRGAWCGGPFWWHLLGTITLLGLTGSALKGWRPAPYVALVVLSLGIGFASPPRWVNQAASFVVLLPPVMALIFGSRRAVALSGIGTVAVLVARGGEASPYLDFEFVVPFVTIVAGMVLARGVIESMLRSAYKEALRATAEHARAEVERERAEQEGGRAAQSLSELAVARQSLTEQEERYRLIAENSGDLVVLFDRYHRVVYASPASRAVLGRDPDDLLGRELKEIVAEQDVGEDGA